jgi:hypothetical protein
MMTLCDFLLVPKLQLGNPESEALASQDWKLELPGLRSKAGAWELAYLGANGAFRLFTITYRCCKSILYQRLSITSRQGL